MAIGTLKGLVFFFGGEAAVDLSRYDLSIWNIFLFRVTKFTGDDGNIGILHIPDIAILRDPQVTRCTVALMPLTLVVEL
jgi:hypothetical protein